MINNYYVIQEDDSVNYYTGARNGMFEAEGYEEIDPKEDLVSIVTVNFLKNTVVIFSNM